MTVQPLPVDSLYRTCDPASLYFTTTDELEDLSEVLGQARALEALQLSVGMDRKGLNSSHKTSLKLSKVAQFTHHCLAAILSSYPEFQGK